MHEAELADAGHDAFEHFGRARALEREQRLLLHMVDHDFAGQPAAEIVDVAMLGRAVDDDVEILAAAGRHQIVDDPAVVVEQKRIFGLHVGRGLEVAGHQPLERRVGAAAVDQQLAHVADVEQAGILAGPQMLGDDAFILDRHLIARERHHPPAAGAMPRVERQRVERLRPSRRSPLGIASRLAHSAACSRASDATANARERASAAAPVCRCA